MFDNFKKFCHKLNEDSKVVQRWENEARQSAAKRPINCPKCHSEQVTANKNGFSAKKAVTGAVLTGGIGLLAGFHGNNKVNITCMNCGNTWRP